MKETRGVQERTEKNFFFFWLKVLKNAAVFYEIDRILHIQDQKEECSENREW